MREYLINTNKYFTVHLHPLPSSCKPHPEVKNQVRLGKHANIDIAVQAAKDDGYGNAVACKNDVCRVL